MINSSDPAQLSVGLQELFPTGVIVAESRAPGDPALLLPGEAEQLGRAVPKRVREFAAGRLCARRALAEFGVREFVLRVADDRRPIWPAGFVGSISHTAGLCAAAVAERRDIWSLGLDCEVAGAVPADIRSTICSEPELEWVSSLPVSDQAAAVTLVFSAKEAFYKCQYPVVGEWLDFHDLHVEPIAWGEPAKGFRLSATRRIAFAEFAVMPMLGRYMVQDGFIATGVALPARLGRQTR